MNSSIPWGAKQRFQLFMAWTNLVICAITLPYSAFALTYMVLFETFDPQAWAALLAVFIPGIVLGAMAIQAVPDLYRDVRNFRMEYYLNYINRHF